MKKLLLLGSVILSTHLLMAEITSSTGVEVTTTSVTGTTTTTTPVASAEVDGTASTEGVSGDIDLTTQLPNAIVKAKAQCKFDLSLNDLLPANKCEVGCFNAVDIGVSGGAEVNIHTHTAGAQFQLRLRHRHGCGWGWHNHIAVALVDNTTGKLITEPKEINASVTTDDVDASFEVDGHAYRSVSVRFFHIKPEKCNFSHGFRWMHQCQVQAQNMHEEKIDDVINTPFVPLSELQCYEVNETNWMHGGDPIACPTNYTELEGMIKSEIPEASFRECAMNHFRFRYAIPKADKCYKIENPCSTSNEAYISKSSDSFAIRPAHFRVHLPSHIKQNIPVPVKIEVVDSKGNIIENYNNSSANLDVTFSPNVKAQYAFDIVNGKGSGTVKFLEAVNGVKMEVSDPHFADIDKDDTSSNNRTVDTDTTKSTNSDDSSSTTSDVSSHNPSKYWAGVGTNESENNPTKNTIDSDIRQNTTKDLHYKRMGW
jgi:hypothetical protein